MLNSGPKPGKTQKTASCGLDQNQHGNSTGHKPHKTGRDLFAHITRLVLVGGCASALLALPITPSIANPGNTPGSNQEQSTFPNYPGDLQFPNTGPELDPASLDPELLPHPTPISEQGPGGQTRNNAEENSQPALMRISVPTAQLQLPRLASNLPSYTVTRVAGANRFATNAASLSEVGADKQQQAFVVSGLDFPDALVASAASAKQDVPLKLVAPNAQNVAGQGAVLVGGAKKVPDSAAPGAPRVAGRDRYETAARLAQYWTSAERVFVTTGTDFADALTAITPAQTTKSPILLTKPDVLDANTSRELRRLAPPAVFIIGGGKAVSSPVENQIRQLLPGAAIGRISGTDRHETAAKVSQFFYGVADKNVQPVLVHSHSFADALSAANILRGTTKAPLLYTQEYCLPKATASELVRLGSTQLRVMGGSKAIFEGAWTNICTPEFNQALAAALQKAGLAPSVPATPSGQPVAPNPNDHGCGPESAAARAALPPQQRAWCPAPHFHQPVSAITPIAGGAVQHPGWNGVKVRAVQRALGLGNRWSSLDGATQRAVRSFQSRAGLPASGAIDQATWERINPGYPWNIDAWQTPVAVAPNATREQRIEQMISFAYSKLGIIYTWGGAGPDALGYDCSGLLLQAMYSAGVDPQPINVLHHAEPLYRSTQEMYKDPHFQKVPVSQRQRGDIIVYHGRGGVVNHVSLYLGRETILESLPPRAVVKRFYSVPGLTVMPYALRPIAND